MCHVKVSLLLVQVYKRLQEIDAYGAEARAATILAGLSFDNSMQVRDSQFLSLYEASNVLGMSSYDSK